MNNQFYRPEDTPGFQYEKHGNNMGHYYASNNQDNKGRRKDEDLIIEENTIYEIDRECFERLKKSKKRR